LRGVGRKNDDIRRMADAKRVGGVELARSGVGADGVSADGVSQGVEKIVCELQATPRL
jgi:hypothetical protein